MKIKRLKIENLRNITNIEFDPAPCHNIISGNNGAGKTTLLEAIYLLARAKSFRTNLARSPIQQGKDQITVFSELVDNTKSTHKLGLSKTNSEINFRLNGSPVTKLSDLASSVPISLVTPQSHRLIEDGPDQRRRLLNWGVFHVEHEYKYLAARLNRTLLQRNNALRKGTKDLSVWDKAFEEASELVHQLQIDYFQHWFDELSKLTKEIPFLNSVTVQFSPGWPEGTTLSSSIHAKERIDRERGFTSIGAHRADILFKIDGVATKHILSRGQQKVLITCILKAQTNVLEQQTGKQSILLFDDIDSELDTDSLNYVSKLISDEVTQTFITTIHPDKLTSISNGSKSGMFHVEQGRLA